MAESRVAVFVINLAGSDARLLKTAQQLENEGLGFQRVEAFDGRKLHCESLDYYDDKRARSYFGRSLVGGEIGCYISHLNSARAFLGSDARYGLVLEDDVCLCAGFAALLQQITDFLDTQPELAFDVINLGNPRLKIATKIRDFGGFSLFHAHYFPMTTTALLWSRSGAEDFVRNHDRIWLPVDNYLRHVLTRSNRGLAFFPAPAPAFGTSSEIDQAAGQARRKSVSRGLGFELRKQRRLWGDKIIALRWRLRTALGLL